MYYEWRSDSEKQCSAKWKKAGKLFYLLYPLQLCPGTPRGLCYTKITVQHRVRAGVSSELTAKQTSQKPLQTPSTQKGLEPSCPGEHLLRVIGKAFISLFHYFPIVSIDLGWVKVQITSGKEQAKWSTKVARQ